MTTELVTAHAGKNHVGSEDVGALYAGALGSGRFAFDVGEGLAVTMTDANTVRVGTGVFLMDGRQVRVKEAESVKVANGSQGAFRRDLVIYTYKRDPSNGNVEEGTWSVLQGTAAASEAEAKAPDYAAGNILDGDLTATVAVAEVSISGLTPTARLLLPSVASLRTLGDSVSHAETHGEKDITFTPKVDCDVLVLCAVSGIWGYAGGTVTAGVDCDQLEAVSKHVGRFSGGNTEYHQLTFWGVFRGAKAGTEYSFTISMTGDPQSGITASETTSICMAVNL